MCYFRDVGWVICLFYMSRNTEMEIKFLALQQLKSQWRLPIYHIGTIFQFLTVWFLMPDSNPFSSPVRAPRYIDFPPVVYVFIFYSHVIQIFFVDLETQVRSSHILQGYIPLMNIVQPIYQFYVFAAYIDVWKPLRGSLLINRNQRKLHNPINVALILTLVRSFLVQNSLNKSIHYSYHAQYICASVFQGGSLFHLP